MTAITASPPLRRAVPLRIGLVLATLLAVAGAVPALMIGLDGSAWDPIVIIIAVLSGGVALGTLALVAFAWNGRRGPCPAFLLPAEETGPGAVIGAVIGIALALAACALIIVGMRRAE